MSSPYPYSPSFVKQKKSVPMDQYILSQKNLLQMLEKAFIAGYESPMGMMDQEITKIYEDAFADLKPVAKPKISASPPATAPPPTSSQNTFHDAYGFWENFTS